MKREGFRNTAISVLFPFNEGHEGLRSRKGHKGARRRGGRATSGAVIGGALGWLAGIGVLAILGGVGVGAAVGGLTGALIGIGIPEHVDTCNEGHIKDGCILLSVH